MSNILCRGRNEKSRLHNGLCLQMVGLDWIVGIRPVVRMWDLDLEGEYPPWGSFKGSHLREFWGETTENSKRLDRQARQGIQLSPSDTLRKDVLKNKIVYMLILYK